MDRLIQRRLSDYVYVVVVGGDHFDNKNKTAAGNLRKSLYSSPLSEQPDTSAEININSHQSNSIDYAALEKSSPQQHIHEEVQVEVQNQKHSEIPSTTPKYNRSSDNEARSKVIEVSRTVVWNADTYRAVQSQGAEFYERHNVILVGDEKGYINKKGQLVVDVDETYLFWNNGQEKLCSLLQNMTLVEALGSNSKAGLPKTLLNATMDCVDHNENKQGFGQGNWVTAIYAARMAAALAGVDFKFQCQDGQNSKMKLLLPWFDKYQVAIPMNGTTWPHGGDRPTEREACPPKYPHLRIDKMANVIQDDLRKMAVSLVGRRDDIRQHPEIPEDAIPLISGVELDDVAVHFRCGDVLGGARRNDFGMIRFNEYKKWIPNTTKSIGILTQPFEKERNRGQDSRKADSCRTVVYALVDYLQQFAPNAKISIHNGVNETFPLAYARLVMANHSITSLSSFGIFPIIGTFGQGYFQKGNRGVNPFATHIPNILSNIHQMEADVRGTGQMRGKSIENLIKWFVNDAAVA